MLRRVNPLLWLAVTAALILGSEQSVQAGQPQPTADGKSCQMKKLTSVDVRSIGAGQFLVPVRIAGRDVWMSLALEEGILTLYGAAIADWHLNTIRMANGSRRIMFMGKPITDMVREDFSLGTQGFQSWPMIVVPASAIPSVSSFEGKPIVGQLAARFLTAVDAEINLAYSNITLFEQVKCGSAAAYWGGTVTAVHFEFDQTGLLHFPMQLEQQEIQTSFDTSSRYSRISTEVTKKFFGFDEQSPGLQSEPQANGTRSHSYRAMALTAAGLDIKDARIELWTTQSCRPDRSLSRLNGIGCQDVYGITPFAIGTDLLKQLHIYIASKEHMVYFTRVDPSAPVAAVAAGAPAR